jgi:hypothetical protein
MLVHAIVDANDGSNTEAKPFASLDVVGSAKNFGHRCGSGLPCARSSLIGVETDDQFR